jgi:hypothetical protein
MRACSRLQAAPVIASTELPWSGAWLNGRGLAVPKLTRWSVEIALDAEPGPVRADFDERTATRFHIDIYAEEWGFFFCHAGRASWIRVTDVPFVHGRDDFNLLDVTPPLRELGALLGELEHHHAVDFPRDRALVRTNLPYSEARIRAWIESL